MAFADLSFPNPTWILLVTKMRYKGPRAIPRDADKSVHKAGTGVSSGFRPENTTHYPDRARLDRCREGSKGNKACHPDYHSWGPNRNQTTAGRSKSFCSHPRMFSTGTAGEGAESGRPAQTPENRVRGMLGDWRGHGGPLPMWPPPEFIISWPKGPSSHGPAPLWVSSF